MTKHILLAALVSTGLALAPAAFAADDMKKNDMSKTDKMGKTDDKMGKKTDTMAKPGDAMKKDGMMDKKDTMSKGKQ
jgi:pentapeptide MXKDX repeat protein